MGKHSMSSKRGKHLKSKITNQPTQQNLKNNQKNSKSHEKRRLRKRKSNFVLHLLELLSIGLIIYSGFHIYKWYNDSVNTKQEVDDILNTVNVQEVDDTNDVTIVESKEDKSSPYWDYIKMKLIDVDFSELKEINSDTIRMDSSKRNKY